MNWNTIFLILCSIGAVQSFFLGGYFLSTSKGRRLPNRLLGLMLLAVGFRVAKSTLWLYYREVSDVVLNIGFAAHLAIVPLLMLYVISFRSSFQWKWYHYLHFLPFLVVMVLATELTTGSFWYRGGYSALLYHSLFYLLATGYFIGQAFFNTTDYPVKAKTWLSTLFLSIALFCMAYFLNYELLLTSYVTGPVVYSGIVYFISFYLLRNHSFFNEEVKSKYRNIHLKDADVEKYREKVKKVVEEGQLYLEPDFTLSQLSEMTKVPKHLLSNLFNMHLKQSFTDYTNQFRINKAIELLNDPAYENHKISAIAYECGFNTLSAFNAAFKKNTNRTPSEFRKTLIAKV